MPALRINGGRVVYELLGDRGAPPIVLTPGGRFSKDVPGLRPLADALVEGGMHVLLWDRPNCGGSDVQFFGLSESHMRAETLRALLTDLDLGPCVIAGGSGGARDSMVTVMLYPELASKLVVWNIVGGILGVFHLGAHYMIPSIRAVLAKGIDGVIELPEWQALIAANPENRQRFYNIGNEELERVLRRWLDAFVSRPGQTIPGIDDWMFERINMPTLIIRGGAKDPDHPKRTSLEVSCLIQQSTLIDPPWPEDAWEAAMRDRAAGRVQRFNMFDTWVLAAPAILDFARR